METILRHCSVMNPKDFRNADYAGDDVFYCEYEYDIHWHNFKRLADIDDEPEVDVHNLYQPNSVLRSYATLYVIADEQASS